MIMIMIMPSNIWYPWSIVCVHGFTLWHYE
jgi:hypothetical protein